MSADIYESKCYTKPIKITKKLLFKIMRGQRPQTLNIGVNSAIYFTFLTGKTETKFLELNYLLWKIPFDWPTCMGCIQHIALSFIEISTNHER